MDASSAELKKTLVSFPIRFGKFRVEVDMTVDPWLTGHQPSPTSPSVVKKLRFD